ncbi:hypothetical protein [Roseospira visakhapatnamensis]|uniref:Uncharacterized protein n=1 Tax=Roseospira visakhapatnamensis TaxID=390880 RepID=A0A7W6W8H6_9PROT|nr:hypothetical protein [Roseospira visakhapatnamensis]MBB4264426.1 hypothetical protein [Roseospira visakhapatnamensis]
MDTLAEGPDDAVTKDVNMLGAAAASVNMNDVMIYDSSYGQSQGRQADETDMSFVRKICYDLENHIKLQNSCKFFPGLCTETYIKDAIITSNPKGAYVYFYDENDDPKEKIRPRFMTDIRGALNTRMVEQMILKKDGHADCRHGEDNFWVGEVSNILVIHCDLHETNLTNPADDSAVPAASHNSEPRYF